ncbi:MAG: LamG domain-containing protein, partial [Sedimentisphaerales bacterium]|nr:LamG domain-containing protein [Sedimentisphaerales bacterium]
WYYSLDTIVGDDTVIGSDSPEYTITGATVADQGYYYCSVINGSGQPVISPFALVEVAQLMAHYSFDVTDPLDASVVVDSSARGNNGIALFYNGTAEESSTADYGTGFVGNGLLLGSGQMKHVQIPCSVRNSFTISAWVNTAMTAGTGDWWNGAGIVDGEMTGFVSDFGLVLNGTKFALGSGPSGATTSSVKDINDGQWHFVVATRDITEGEMKVYVDGHRDALAVNDIGSVYAATDVLNIGKVRFENIAAKYFVGTIDEVRIYNYVLDEVSIADSYLTAVPGSESICIESQRPEAAYDLDGNCEVNVADFALLASKWLECGLFPDCVE